MYRKRDNLKVERRDGSKGIKKGDNPRKITTGQLRREQGKRGGRDGDRRGKPDRGGKGGRGGKRFRKGGRKEERPKTADALDREMENYWVKAGNPDQGKLKIKLLTRLFILANERLDDDLANYFVKNAVVPAEAAAEGKEVAKVEEEKKE